MRSEAEQATSKCFSFKKVYSVANNLCQFTLILGDSTTFLNINHLDTYHYENALNSACLPTASL